MKALFLSLAFLWAVATSVIGASPDMQRSAATLQPSAIDDGSPGIHTIPLSENLEIRYYSTGWVELAPGETRTFEHNLGGDADQYFVFCDFYKSFLGPGEEGIGINQIFYGGVLSSGSGWHGGRWQGLDETKIELYRYPNDIRVEKIRARILAFIFKS